ncbi:MAG: MerR family DNA-binding transcriptional regulator [Pseudohongiellaceae bacterium]
MLIGEASKKSGCHIETIRYYERIGLLSPTARTAALRYRGCNNGKTSGSDTGTYKVPECNGTGIAAYLRQLCRWANCRMPDSGGIGQRYTND